MKQLAPQVELVNQIMEQGRNAGILHHTLSNQTFDGKTVIINGSPKMYFGNCSYLGLENDERLKQAAIESIQKFGIQFSSSRTYARMPLYEEAEDLLSQIFGKPTIATPSTTLAHIATLPNLVQRNDAVIIDQQAHTSMYNVMAMLKSAGIRVERIRHNDMNALESHIMEFHNNYDRIWFLTDGVYSMFGDGAPIQDMWQLLRKYDKLHLYVDDAHGMSCAGKRGEGWALSQFPYFHERMVLIVSLSKGFGASGGAVVVPTEEMRRLIVNVGTSLVFTIQMPTATLAAIIASAKIHLSAEITQRQERLNYLMTYFNITAKAKNLPLIREAHTPINYIGVGTPDSGAEITKRMLDSGYLVNPASYPSVPYKHTGVRILMTTHLTEQDIFDMATTLSRHLDEMEEKKAITRAEIRQAFEGREEKKQAHAQG
jgi:7-keto-8-aminopelargonate synthetase-like enzyme